MHNDLMEKRWHKAEKISWMLQVIPFVRFIAVNGSLAYGMSRESSDIDMFIIAKRNRIWLSRLFLTMFLRMIKQYHYIGTDKRPGKICPNRFVSDDYLLITPQDAYHAQDYTQMVPLFDQDNYYEKFIAKNKWMEKFGFFKPHRALTLVKSRTLTVIRKIFEFTLDGNLGDIWEQSTKSYQLKKLEKSFPDLNQKDSSIIATDKEIRIHPKKDYRQYGKSL